MNIKKIDVGRVRFAEDMGPESVKRFFLSFVAVIPFFILISLTMRYLETFGVITEDNVGYFFLGCFVGVPIIMTPFWVAYIFFPNLLKKRSVLEAMVASLPPEEIGTERKSPAESERKYLINMSRRNRILAVNAGVGGTVFCLVGLLIIGITGKAVGLGGLGLMMIVGILTFSGLMGISVKRNPQFFKG